MGTIPARQALTGAKFYRKILSFFEDYLVLPKINPSWFQLAGLLLSLGYIYLNSDITKLWFLVIILILDWLDGASARMQGKASLSGWMIDVLIDRLSEGFIFWAEIGTKMGYTFFILWILNCVLSIYSVKSGKHVLLAIRFAFIFVLLYRILWI